MAGVVVFLSEADASEDKWVSEDFFSEVEEGDH